MEFLTIEPKILYFGTPVALISSLNEDGSTNLAPMSSFRALGWTLVLGLLDETKTAANLERHPECVVNLPSLVVLPRTKYRDPSPFGYAQDQDDDLVFSSVILKML